MNETRRPAAKRCQSKLEQVPCFERWRKRARRLKDEAAALSLAVRDPRTPWPAKALAAAVVGYLVSPIDLIPDVIPVLGLVDELVLLPAAIGLVVRLIPETVMADCRSRAAVARIDGRAWIGVRLIIAVWAVMIGVSLLAFV